MHKIKVKTKLEIFIIIFFLILLGAIVAESITRTITDTQDNVYTLIRNSNGKYWEATAANIQVAIDDLSNTSGSVWLPGLQTFTISDTIIMGIDVTLDLGGSKIKPSSNFYVIHMMPGSQLENGFIDVSSITTFNHACILFDGKDSEGNNYLYSNHPQTSVFNMGLISANDRGTAIQMVCDHSTNEEHSISGVSIRHIRAKDFYYTIYMSATNGEAGEPQWINATHFDDVWANYCAWAIYIKANGNNNYVSGNDFNRIGHQASTGVQGLLYCDGWYNKFTIISFDWNAWGSGKNCYEFTSTSKCNIIDAAGGKSSYVDNGNGNLKRIS